MSIIGGGGTREGGEMLRSKPRATPVATAVAQAGALSLMLTSCYPFGCGSSRCVDEHVYANAKRCRSVFAASLIIVDKHARLPSSAKYDASGVRAALVDGLGGTVASGMELGMSRDAVYADLEQAKNAYLKAYNARPGSPPEKIRTLFDDIDDCVGDPNA